MAARTVILTGERGVGKTTVCQKTVALAQARQYKCAGILTVSCTDGARDVVDVRSGDLRRLTVEPGTDQGVIQGRFCFDAETLTWGGDVLAQAAPCHLLVIDELGPLEVERGAGWQNVFDVLSENGFRLALAVVRPELLVRVQLRLPASATTVLTVTAHNRDGLPSVFLQMLSREVGS